MGSENHVKNEYSLNDCLFILTTRSWKGEIPVEYWPFYTISLDLADAVRILCILNSNNRQLPFK